MIVDVVRPTTLGTIHWGDKSMAYLIISNNETRFYDFSRRGLICKKKGRKYHTYVMFTPVYHKLGIQLLSYMDGLKCKIRISKWLPKLDSNQIENCCFPKLWCFKYIIFVNFEALWNNMTSINATWLGRYQSTHQHV